VQALRDAGKVQAGERVLIIGASGGVGSYAVQLAKAYGATVAAVCSTSKVERVRALGADHVIDYKQQDFADGSQQYDLILDIGGNTAVSKLRRAMTPTARLIFVGAEQAGYWTAGFERQLYGALLGLFVKQRFVPLMSQERWQPMQEVAELAEQGKLRPAIDRQCTLAEIPRAITDLEAGKVFGKIAVRVA
jgi:NADPH:quinone reductase-like Zn-dependent oxidoreductase